jgi:hypothetical protein
VNITETVSAHAVDLLRDVEAHPDRLGVFTQRIDATAQHFRSLGRLSESGYRTVISLDFCELLDSGHMSGVHTPLARRRIIADIGFSRAAMAALKESTIAFTILPGTIAEILLFLSTAYARNTAFMATLASTGAVPIMRRITAESVDEAIETVSTADADLAMTVQSFSRNLAVTNRLMEAVEELVIHPNFVPPQKLGLHTGLLDRDQYHQLYNALSALRGDTASVASNVADALNLAVVAALTSDDARRVVIHMTRTPSLHKLGKKGVIVDMSVLFSGSLGEFPIVCRPDALWLFLEMTPIMTDGRVAYSLVEAIYRSWTAIGSHLRVLEATTHTEERGRNLENTLRELDSIRTNTSIGVAFQKYLDLYVDSAIRAEQLGDDLSAPLIDRKEQVADLNAQSASSNALLQQEHIRRLFGILRRLHGPDRAILTSGVTSNEATGTSPSTAYAFLREAGLQPIVSRDDGVAEIVIHHPVSELMNEAIVLVGCQLYMTTEGQGCTIYWPTSCKIKLFLKAVGALEPDTEFFILMGFEESGVDYL